MNNISVDLSNKKPDGLKTFLGQTHFKYVIIVCSDKDKQCPAIFGLPRSIF